MSITNLESVTPVDMNIFRNVVGHFASGVTVITTAVDGQLYGTTASAVSSLSMEPPMMLACLNRSSSTHDRVVEAGVFGINILAEDQGALAFHFGRKGEDKFATVPHTLSEEGIPLIDGALATIVCHVAETPTGGTHTVFLGLVSHAEAHDREPLAYYRGTMGRLEPTKELAAYQATRNWVLLRTSPLGEDLDIDAIAAASRAEADHVANALVKLESEHLVFRTETGKYQPKPITAELTDSAYDSRATIESGVIASQLGKISEETISTLREITAKLADLRETSESDLEEFLALNVAYHDALVGVAGSSQLVDSFRRLGIGTVWRQALTPEQWSRQLDHRHVAELTEALAAGDAPAAQAALAAHTEFGKTLAREVVARHGGQV
ncbi:flavin reductase [Glutamicibacter sp. MNS18]|jgi:flavin reductase (DIM6/NTAB) family NADH-FMN oxidoreductase RutF|uniref:Flavin reductase (DIM6/NTAB) family NADH-FMN oxidoreductase RutF n=1 Tax=Glutamicibacter mysorens TaxID=257984 RepID=A0ABX4N0Y6_9MICC|nr:MULTISPECIES: flavin reductase [Glutamicibacter]MCW4467232.1 flavin reductase [Glutamicibacter sp. MNS18]PJJ45298.1 flavin reductase (DIM6/NTAB) family NADH-FMN oxidoreductase RutF [Glutamicibacter mysorens]WIV43881.1 flavin reductase [Glutamicibacter nicotianae]